MFLSSRAFRLSQVTSSCSPWNTKLGLLLSTSVCEESVEAPVTKPPKQPRVISRKAKAEIFNKDLGKKPKVHLKPSLLSKISVNHPKEIYNTSNTRQQRHKANVALAGAEEFEEVAEAKTDALYDSEDLRRVRELELPEALVSVEAFFIARSVDLKALAGEQSLNVIPCRNHVVIRVRDGARSREDYTPMPGCLSNDRVAVVFQYGSVVLFNFEEFSVENEVFKMVKKHSKEVIVEAKRDNYRVVVIPELDRWSKGGSDKIMVKKLDVDGVRIISLVLGQSIALDHYTRSIDEMLNTFGELNRHMELTGTFNMKRKALFKLVAAANAALADAILRLGLLERSDAAWQSAKYDRIWEHMREDFELDDRFESLEFKIGIIQHNVKFFLDILQNRKSDTLEWIIIFLIAGEICVSVFDILRGTGAI